MRCPKCGNEPPQGSAFCNHCGTPLNNEVACPLCGNMIPAESVFCPKCGRMVRNDMADETTRQSATAAGGEMYNEQRRREQAEQQRREQAEQRRHHQAVRQQTANAWETPDPDEDNADDDQGGNGSSFNRNLLIGIAAAVIVIGGLLWARSCGNNDSSRKSSDRTEAAENQPMGNVDPMAVFAAELNRNNLQGDGASATAAVFVPGSGEENPDRIWGVTSLSDGTSRTFFKIYQLTRTGNLWQTEPLHVQYLDGRTITMSTSALIADYEKTPRAVKIGDKECLYFTYMDTPGGEGTQGRVSLNLFDIAAKKLISLDYVGTVKSRSDGRRYIYGKPLDAINSPERRFLKDEAQNIKILYFPTDEELKAEQEQREKEEMEKRMASPDSADARWNQENKEKMEQAQSGEEVTMKRSTYDKPIFHKDDISKQINSETYSVFLTKQGSVYGFDLKTRKYFTVYSNGATDMGFNDTKNNLLGIRTSSGGHFQVNLATGSTKALTN